VGRNSFRGPIQQNWDVHREDLVGHRKPESQVFVDMFSAWNQPVFDKPSITDIENPSFGQITNTVGNPRLMQISLRYAF